VVCTACGFENQVGNRYCGMCGTPLPHRPMTAPGAHSTLGLTRVPEERAAERHRHAGDGNRPGTAPTGKLLEMLDPGSTVLSQKQPGTQVPPAPEMVPEVPLDEYVRRFHYQPPDDPVEITMRGDETTVAPECAAPVDLAPERPAPVEAAPLSASDDVRDRLGLETVEDRSDRPRFLDFSKPAPQEQRSQRTSVTTGASFMGLSDAPEVTADEIEPPARGGWRVWFALAALVVFGGLGYMEWRSQVHQSNNGPIEVIRAKIRDLRHALPSETDQPNAADSNAAKLETQVGPQPKELPPDHNAAAKPAAPSAATGSNPAVPEPQPTLPTAGTQPPVAQKATAPVQTSGPVTTPPPASENSSPQKPMSEANPSQPATTPSDTQAAPPAAAAPKPKPRTPPEQPQDAAVNAAIPGMEEMTRARNASDSAAAAAWLWKATAKGNPDAPVLLADRYIRGDGVPRSCEQALVLLKTAATKENARARNRLASLYAAGSCVRRDRAEAYRWMSSALAANPNSQWTQQNRDLLWQQMTPEERSQAEQYR
jgi:hypothetical protein